MHAASTARSKHADRGGLGKDGLRRLPNKLWYGFWLRGENHTGQRDLNEPKNRSRDPTLKTKRKWPRNGKSCVLYNLKDVSNPKNKDLAWLTTLSTRLMLCLLVCCWKCQREHQTNQGFMLANQTFPQNFPQKYEHTQDSYLRFLKTHGYDPAVTVPSFGASMLRNI